LIRKPPEGPGSLDQGVRGGLLGKKFSELLDGVLAELERSEGPIPCFPLAASVGEFDPELF